MRRRSHPFLKINLTFGSLFHLLRVFIFEKGPGICNGYPKVQPTDDSRCTQAGFRVSARCVVQVVAPKSGRAAHTTMNSALFHAARPGDIRSGVLGGRGGGGGGVARGEIRPGMREAAAVADEMGFGQDFGPQVRRTGRIFGNHIISLSSHDTLASLTRRLHRGDSPYRPLIAHKRGCHPLERACFS